MAEQSLNLFLDGRFAGTVIQDSHGRVSFAYDDAYRTAADAYPVSLAMPLTARMYGSRQILPFLAGLLPDNDATLARLGRVYGVSANSPFALLAHTGRDAAGAVQLLPEDVEPDDARARREAVSWLDDDQLADAVRSLASHRDWNPGLDVGRWSLAGAQSKMALFRNESGRFGVPADATPTTHILKPAAEAMAGHEVNEFLAMKAAAQLGLRVARVELIDVAGQFVFVTERYDRVRARSGVWRRLHQEDMCQSLSVMPAKKYQSDGGPGVSEMAGRTAILRGSRSRERFFDALVFNVCIGNTDAHAKNYSILISAGLTTLAPLYDLGSIHGYPIRRAPRSAARIGDHVVFSQISNQDWAKVARKLALPEEAALERVRFLQRNVVGAYRQSLDELPRNIGANARATGQLITDRLAEIATDHGWGTGD